MTTQAQTVSAAEKKASGGRRGDTQSCRRKIWPSQAAIQPGTDHDQASHYVSGTNFAQFLGDESWKGSAAALLSVFLLCQVLDGIVFAQCRHSWRGIGRLGSYARRRAARASCRKIRLAPGSV